MKARELLKQYPEDKAKDLMNRLKKAGMYQYDEDFPKDDEVRGA